MKIWHSKMSMRAPELQKIHEMLKNSKNAKNTWIVGKTKNGPKKLESQNRTKSDMPTSVRRRSARRNTTTAFATRVRSTDNRQAWSDHHRQTRPTAVTHCHAATSCRRRRQSAAWLPGHCHAAAFFVIVGSHHTATTTVDRRDIVCAKVLMFWVFLTTLVIATTGPTYVLGNKVWKLGSNRVGPIISEASS